MAIEVKLPDLGEGIESGDILQVFIAVGDTVAKDQNILEVETDKATVDVPSDASGTVVEIHVTVGDSVTSGQRLITLEPSSNEDAAATHDTNSAVKAAPPTTGDGTPAQPEPTPPAAAPAVSTPTAEPVTPEPSPAAVAPEPNSAAVAPEPNSATAAPPAAPVAPAAVPVASSGAVADPAEAGKPIPAGPAIRRFAREVGVDLSKIQGTGAGGRITRDDVLESVRSSSTGSGVPAAESEALPSAEPAASEPSSAAPTQPAASAEEPGDDVPGTPGTDAWGPTRSEKMPKIRKAIAANMHASWTSVPRVTNFDDADITELERIRQASKADYLAKGIKLSSMPFLIKAVSMALRDNPKINASLDMENQQVIYKRYVNVGIAVDTERGLIVPVMRDTDKMTIAVTARELSNAAEKVRTGRFDLEDIRGGTFTISNLGSIGGTYSTPIVNTPEVAILLVGRSRKLPVVVDDEIVVRLMMPLSLSYDHRLIDGGTAARFLNDVIGYLESPSRLLMAP